MPHDAPFPWPPLPETRRRNLRAKLADMGFDDESYRENGVLYGLSESDLEEIVAKFNDPNRGKI